MNTIRCPVCEGFRYYWRKDRTIVSPCAFCGGYGTVEEIKGR